MKNISFVKECRDENEKISYKLGKIFAKDTSNKELIKRVGGVAQVVQCLPSKCEALSSTTSTTKQRTYKNT
jgi:hypothetical protein